MDKNKIYTNGFSNPSTRKFYENKFHYRLDYVYQQQKGRQCGSCSFYAKFHTGYGLCCNERSDFYKETIINHFTCKEIVDESWEHHSFSSQKEDHVKMAGI